MPRAAERSCFPTSREAAIRTPDPSDPSRSRWQPVEPVRGGRPRRGLPAAALSRIAPWTQRVSLITLGVDDISRARGFYEALGWHDQQVEDTVFFQAGGLAIVLWGRSALADDAGVSNTAEPHGLAGIALAHNVRSRQEVDQLLDQHGERAPRSPELRPRPSTGLCRLLRRSRWPFVGGRQQPGLHAHRRRPSGPPRLRLERGGADQGWPVDLAPAAAARTADQYPKNVIEAGLGRETERLDLGRSEPC